MASFINCFVCNKIFKCPHKFFKHLGLCYTFVDQENYICKFGKCFQKFSYKCSFKRHVLNHFKKNIDQNDTASCSKKNIDQNVRASCSKNNNEQSNFISECCAGVTSDIPSSEINVDRVKYNGYLKALYNNASKLIIKLHGFNNISKSDINKIKNGIETNIIFPVVEFLEKLIPQNVLKDSEIGVEQIFSDLKELFKEVKTDYTLEKNMICMNLISKPHSFQVGNNKKDCGTIMPIEFQLKKIFESNDFLDEVLPHMDKVCKNDKYVNFIQGDLWRQKCRLYPKKTLIPYFIYVDDFGINNPIGSKATNQAMCNVYYSFPCLPAKSSKLNSVFLACTVKSSHVKLYGSNECFSELINILKKIEVEGLEIRTKSGITTVHFIMGLILGDNLGLNTIMNFSKSFSANYFCRFCEMKKCDTQKSCTEEPNLRRNRLNYKNNISNSSFSETGIVSDSLFNTIPSFHVTENFCVDLMHDLFEGICHYILCESILYFMKTMNYFTLDCLNNRLQIFLYVNHDKGSEKFSFFIREFENRRLKLSAKQMMAFCHYLPILLGDLVPFEDVVWKFILNFLDLIDDLLCYEVSNNLLLQISIKIESINQEYQNLFKKHLTPKFHFLLHYKLVIQQSGPLRNLWSYKYEAKHKEFKIFAHAITSRKNIPKTFAFKQQMRFANFILEPKLYQEVLYKKQAIDLRTKELICRKLKIDSKNLTLYNEAEIYGYKYSKTSFIANFTEDINLYSIKYIVRVKNNVDILFCGQKVITEFSFHYSAFEIKNQSEIYDIISFSKILGPPTDVIKTYSGKQFLKIKEFYRSIH